MSTETHEKSHTELLYEQAMRHFETRWEYLSLVATEKISEVIASLASLIAVGLFSIMTLFFFSIGFAFWLGDLINSRAGGFALAGLIFIPIAVASFYFVKPFVRTKIIQNILEDADIPDQEGR